MPTNLVYSTNFTGFSGNLQTNDTWTLLGVNSATCDGVNVDIPGNGERTYKDGKTPSTADMYAQALCNNNGGDRLGVLIRAVDVNNWYWGYYNKSTGYWTIDQNNGGTITNLAQVFEGGQPASMVLKLEVNTGQGLTLYKDGVSKLTATGTRSGTSGSGGLYGIDASGSSWDDYALYDSGGGLSIPTAMYHYNRHIGSGV